MGNFKSPIILTPIPISNRKSKNCYKKLALNIKDKKKVQLIQEELQQHS